MSKRQKLADWGKDAYVSASAMSKLLNTVEAEGLPDAFSPSSIARDRIRTASQMTDFGPLVAARESIPFNRFLREALDKSSNQLSICIYNDEITPGNPIKEANKRKLQAIYNAPTLAM
eukprot:9503997-Pyramimonas_sp.AAC.2